MFARLEQGGIGIHPDSDEAAVRKILHRISLLLEYDFLGKYTSSVNIPTSDGHEITIDRKVPNQGDGTVINLLTFIQQMDSLMPAGGEMRAIDLAEHNERNVIYQVLVKE